MSNKDKDFKQYLLICSKTLSTVPSASPQNFGGYNISKNEILVSWDVVAPDHVNGIILGYYVTWNEIQSSSGEAFNKSVLFPSTNTTFGGLQPFTFYSFQVAAYTIKGKGPFSENITVRTEEEGELSINFCAPITRYM